MSTGVVWGMLECWGIGKTGNRVARAVSGKGRQKAGTRELSRLNGRPEHPRMRQRRQ